MQIWLTIGKGTFGVVLQAKAEDIVKSAPHRNIVAVKTTRGMCAFISHCLRNLKGNFPEEIRVW